MKEITFGDYLNNSGTRGSEPVYKTSSMSIKKYQFRKNKSGTYTKVELSEPILLSTPLSSSEGLSKEN